MRHQVKTVLFGFIGWEEIGILRFAVVATAVRVHMLLDTACQAASTAESAYWSALGVKYGVREDLTICRFRSRIEEIPHRRPRSGDVSSGAHLIS